MRLTALVLAAALGFGSVGSSPANPGYDGSTSILLPYVDQNWLLLRGTGTLRVSEIDLHVLGAQAGTSNDTTRWPREFGCWYVVDPNVPMLIDAPIGFVDFLPEPKVNSTRNDAQRDYRPGVYGDGLPAPHAGDSIICGWDPKGQGYPDLVNGFGRAHLFYQDG